MQRHTMPAAAKSRIVFLPTFFRLQYFVWFRFHSNLTPALSIAMALVAIRATVHIAAYTAVVRVSLGFAMTIGA